MSVGDREYCGDNKDNKKFKIRHPAREVTCEVEISPDGHHANCLDTLCEDRLYSCFPVSVVDPSLKASYSMMDCVHSKCG